MKVKIYPAGVRVLALAVLTFFCAAALHAQDTTIKTKKQAEVMIPRLSTASVQTLNQSQEVMDTLDTASPFIKIILYSDYTWKYFKLPEYANGKDEFEKFWNTEKAVPYQVSMDELPDEIAVWIVDSLGGFHCPRIIPVYSKFGYRHRRRHQGVDLPLDVGTPVYAAFDGKVRLSRYYKGYGNLVIIRHENGLETFYGHLSKRLAQEGDWVNAGSIIGLGGSTGRSTGPHLHFETRYKGYAFDPEWLIDFASGTLRHRLFVLKKMYLSPASRYVPESEEEEIDIIEGDTQDRIKAEEEAKAKAEAERKAELAKRYYTVRSGDTLGKIAIRNHTTVRKICQLNGIKETTVLQIGQRLRVK